jgi:Holliday junction DNA helicase RuvA
MIYRLAGELVSKKENFIIIDVNRVNYKVFVSPKTHKDLPDTGEELQIYTYLNVKEDALDLYGFLTESELGFFEKLISISGVGPRSALGVMAVAPVNQLIATINEGKPDLLTRASGIGKKTAERVVLELRDKIAALGTEEVVKGMESDIELEEALVSLDYSKAQAKKIISQLDPKLTRLEDRLQAALKSVKK